LWWLSSTAGLRSGLNEVQLASNDIASRWLIKSCERHPFLSGRIEKVCRLSLANLSAAARA
jgi:hypothetical protein